MSGGSIACLAGRSGLTAFDRGILRRADGLIGLLRILVLPRRRGGSSRIAARGRRWPGRSTAGSSADNWADSLAWLANVARAFGPWPPPPSSSQANAHAAVAQFRPKDRFMDSLPPKSLLALLSSLRPSLADSAAILTRSTAWPYVSFQGIIRFSSLFLHGLFGLGADQIQAMPGDGREDLDVDEHAFPQILSLLNLSRDRK